MIRRVIVETDGVVALVGDYNEDQQYVENMRPIYVESLTGDEEAYRDRVAYIRYTIDTKGRNYKESRLKTPEEFEADLKKWAD